ncbi:hypothetical protein BDQ17DRAFT_1437219 [Cyathus striatus]|nr:hypothetical protein BDQ17DRAFT_1437219 [Cyathus striatus]
MSAEGNINLAIHSSVGISVIYHTIYIFRVTDTAFFIHPLMVILALYELLQDILVWTIKDIDYDTLSAANLIIVRSTFAIMIGVTISAVKQQHQQETENVKGQDYV